MICKNQLLLKIQEENNIKTLEDAENCEELWNINNGRTLCRNCHRGINKRIIKQ